MPGLTCLSPIDVLIDVIQYGNTFRYQLDHNALNAVRSEQFNDEIEAANCRSVRKGK